MFWKIIGGIALFFMAVLVAGTLLVTASAAALGVAVGSVVENLDINTVQVTDASGNTETFDVNNLVSDSGRVEIIGDNGDQVTIDFDVPQITVQESGEDAAQVVIGDGSQIRIDGRNIDNFDGHVFVRPIAGFFSGLFTLTVWTLIAVGIWLMLRKRQAVDNTPKEKTPDATA